MFKTKFLNVLLLCLLCLTFITGCNSNNKQTKLINAVKNNDVSTVKKMIDKGANINSKDTNGKTPLMYAVSENKSIIKDTKRVNKNYDLTKLLIDKGADVNAKDNNGTTPLMFAIENNADDLPDLLISKGADVNAKDNVGLTVLMHAMKNSKLHENILNVIFSKKVSNINLQDKDGSTALMYVGKYYDQFNDEEKTKILLNNGANPNIKDKNGRTALMYISMHTPSISFKEMFQANGADLNAKDNNGMTYEDYIRMAYLEEHKADKQSNASSDNEKTDKPDLQVLDHKSESGYIVGTVINNTNNLYHYVEIDINLYDSNGNQVGSTLSNVNNLEPQKEWKFKAAVIDQENVKTYKIVKVSGI